MTTDIAIKDDDYTSRLDRFRALPWSAGRTLQWPMIVMVGIYAIIGTAFIAYYQPDQLSNMPRHLLLFSINSLAMVFIAGAIYAIGHVVRHRPTSPFGSMSKALREEQLSNENLPNFFIAWFALVVAIVVFVKMKVLIPVINPFTIDPALSDLDKWLHFGVYPWQWLEPITHHPVVTWILHRNYYFWFPVIYVTYVWQAATRRDPVLRLQFLLAFVASWIVVGTLMATVMSSAGPIYYDRVAADQPQVYAGAMAYLNDVHASWPLHMMEIKERLWDSYIGVGDSTFIRGISAMPSMHVALSVLLILFGWRKGPIVGMAYTVFGILIGIGSVHLLWHYAIDGYVSIAAVIPIWWVCGVIARRTISETQQKPEQTTAA